MTPDARAIAGPYNRWERIMYRDGTRTPQAKRRTNERRINRQFKRKLREG